MEPAHGRREYHPQVNLLEHFEGTQLVHPEAIPLADMSEIIRWVLVDLQDGQGTCSSEDSTRSS